MAMETGAKVTVAGAGALGLCIALELARRGREVVVSDPAAFGDNASGVAAGMLAPAFEATLDPLAADHFPLLSAARDLWPGFADVALDQSGAVYRGAHGDQVAARLAALGAAGERRVEGVFTPEDWRLSPTAALAVLRAQAGEAGVRFEPASAMAGDGVLVLATGPGGEGLAPELARLTPIKGQILRLAGGPSTGPVVRGDGVYICPDPAGAVVGATMEPGLTDRAIDPGCIAALREAAEQLLPDLAGLEAQAAAGVRAATPDGLPMVGWSRRDGVMLAVGARRNGWLLAPLVARVVAAYLAGEDPGPWAVRLDPRRCDNDSEGA